MITDKEIQIARHCIGYATAHGASAVRVSLNKSVTDACTILNGELDKVSHSADRSIYLYLFVNDRYGTFSTNRLEEADLETFISKALDMVRMLGEDLCRKLPDIGRTAKDAVTGRELGLLTLITRRFLQKTVSPMHSGSADSWKRKKRRKDTV